MTKQELDKLKAEALVKALQDKLLKEFQEGVAEIYKGKENEPSVLWKPKDNESYYNIDSNGEVYESTWEDHPSDDGRHKNGNVFKTCEQAEKFAKKRAARNRLELIAEELNEGIDFNWENSSQKWYIEGNVEYDQFRFYYTQWARSEAVYFVSKELAQQALTYLTDEEKLILWGVK